MSMMRSHLIATAMFALLGACAPENTNSSALIYGGTAVSGTKWSGTVAILINKGDATSLCTGSLIDPKLVVTAAHCLVENGTTTPASAFKVITGLDARSGTQRAVSKANYKPEYKDDALNDMAYLLLAEPITDVEIIPPATDAAEIKALTTVGAPATLVGFGSTDKKDAQGQAVIGVKYETETQVGQPQDGALFIGGQGKDSCQGDSGGPAFGKVGDSWRVFGVTSRGAGCGQGGLYARLNEGLCWMQKDSGITLKDSKLACDGVAGSGTAGKTGDATTATTTTATDTTATKPAAAASLGTDLRFRLGSVDPTVAEAYEFDIAAPKEVAKVSICAGGRDACVASQQESLAARKVDKPDDKLNYFVGERRVVLRADLVITLLGYDAGGKLIHARAVSFAKKP